MITSTRTKAHGLSGLNEPPPTRAVARRPVSPAQPQSRAVRIPIGSSGDIVAARKAGRLLAFDLGFPGPDVTVIATAISEVTRNIIEHAETGELLLAEVRENGRTGMTITARDDGPGIRDAGRVMEYGHGPHDPGVGLPGVRSLMDDFAIKSTLGCGTTVTMTKWVK